MAAPGHHPTPHTYPKRHTRFMQKQTAVGGRCLSLFVCLPQAADAYTATRPEAMSILSMLAWVTLCALLLPESPCALCCL